MVKACLRVHHFELLDYLGCAPLHPMHDLCRGWYVPYLWLPLAHDLRCIRCAPPVPGPIIQAWHARMRNLLLAQLSSILTGGFEHPSTPELRLDPTRAIM